MLSLVFHFAKIIFEKEIVIEHDSFKTILQCQQVLTAKKSDNQFALVSAC